MGIKHSHSCWKNSDLSFNCVSNFSFRIKFCVDIGILDPCRLARNLFWQPMSKSRNKKKKKTACLAGSQNSYREKSVSPLHG